MSNKKTSRELDQLSHLGSKKLQQYILSREAVIIYSPKLDRIVWSNTSGASLFGGRSITEFLATDVVPDHPFLNQVKSAVRQLGKGRINRGFRVVKDSHSRFLQCEIGFIKLKELSKRKNHKKVIIITAANPLMEDLSEYDYANLVLNNLADTGSARAICDEYGLVISATDSFADLEINSDSMEDICTKFSESSKLSTQISNEDTQNTPLNIYALAGESDRILVFADDHSSETIKSDNLINVVDPLSSENIIQAEEIVTDIEPSRLDDEDENLATSELDDEVVENTETIEADDPIALIISDDQSSEKLIDDQDNEQEKIPDEQIDDEVVTEHLSNNSTADETGDAEFDKFQNEFVFSAGADPIRFAWITDTDQVFTFVSKELAGAVGPNAADIVGRKWSDLATVFGFDKNGEISSLLKKQDTWSGKSVLWPVQGTDLHVPVDLAALPTFSSGRNFDGFRGFGIVRMLDTIVDPEETGLALVGVNANDSSPEEIREEGNADQNTNEVEDLPNAPTNIVNLDLRRETKSEEPSPKLIDDAELSNRENRAFHEIGQKLRDSPKSGISRLGNDNEGKEEKKTAAEPVVLHRVDTSMLSELPVPVLVYRGNQTLFANHELLALTGYASFQELCDAGGINALFENDDSAELVNEHEIILKDKDGGQMYVKALLQNVPWDDENAMLLSFRQPKHDKLPDNEKIVLDMMRVSELQNILDTATDGIIILNRDGIIQSINQSTEALFGQTEDNVIEQSINELFASESHKRIDELLKNLREANSQGLLNDGCEVIGIEANGGLIPLFVTIGKVGNSDNYCVILRDMTPWKKSREELVDAKKQAEDANDQKTEFLARISHEIRTPLNAIIGFSDVMIEERFGPIDNERYREYLRDINRSGIHVLDLINDLLDISKIEAGKMELSFEAVDLNQIVGETVALLQPQANGNRVIIRTSLSRAVPKVVADTRSIRQIVLNLVSNAIKFTDANGQVIVSTVYEGNGEVALRVRDTGVGMSEEDISIALKPFRQLNALSETRGQGTGLGLPLTKALVEANKAYFDIESKPGEGTIILIQFPTQRVLAD